MTAAFPWVAMGLVGFALLLILASAVGRRFVGAADRYPLAGPVCPDCGAAVVFTCCQSPTLTPAAADALADVALAAHRKLAHPQPEGDVA